MSDLGYTDAGHRDVHFDFVALLKVRNLNRHDHGERAFWIDKGNEYVTKLACSIARNVDGISHTLHLLTDAIGLAAPLNVANIQPHALDETGHGWWAKLQAFRPDLALGEHAAYLDLDTVITGSLLPFMALRPLDSVIMADDVAIPGLANGSVLRFDGRSPHVHKLWLDYKASPQAIENRFSRWPHASDQAYIADAMRKRGVMQPYIQQQLGQKALLNMDAEVHRGVKADATTFGLVGRNHMKPHNMLDRDIVAEHWRC